MPIVATVVGVLILHAHPHWNQPAGAAIVLTGVAVSLRDYVPVPP